MPTSMKSYSLSGFFEPVFSLFTLLHFSGAIAFSEGLFATAPFSEIRPCGREKSLCDEILALLG